MNRGQDAGETLVELLITVAVLGIAVTAIVGGLMVAVDASSLHRNQAQAQHLLRDWAETVSGVGDTGGYAYAACPAAPAAPAAPALPAGFGAAVSRVENWSGTGWVTSCPSPDLGVRRLTLTITAPTGAYPGFSQSLAVVVRRPCAGSASC